MSAWSKRARLCALLLTASGCSNGTEPHTQAGAGDGDGSASLEGDAGSPEQGDGSDDSDQGDGGSESVEDCVQGTYAAMARPLDMFILLDQSGSMTEDDDRWTPTTEAIASFVETSGIARTGVALQYFPLGSSDAEKCESERYEEPDVAMGELPGNAMAITSSLTAHYFDQAGCCTDEHSGTPTRPAVEGAIAYMRTHLGKHPDHVGVLLLATDGEPSDVCDDNKVEDVAKVIRAAAMSSPPIRTYVIGIGKDEQLAEMAEAGGTGRGPIAIDGSGARTESDLAEALALIRNEVLPCDYPVANVADPTSLNVERSRSGQAQTLVNVPKLESCSEANSNGWYYDDPNAPSRVVLCPDTCADVGSDALATIRIVEGCAIVVL
ncbi:MAG: VWA domain-containing protein [Myxococcales bacterium]